MTDTVKTTTTGTVRRWTLGHVGKAWAVLDLDLGVIDAEVSLSSREAREFAIAVLTDQGPYLGFQPPNEQMREHPRDAPFGSGRSSSRVPWRERGAVQDVTQHLVALREQFGDEAFGWAVQRVLGA